MEGDEGQEDVGCECGDYESRLRTVECALVDKPGIATLFLSSVQRLVCVKKILRGFGLRVVLRRLRTSDADADLAKQYRYIFCLDLKFGHFYMDLLRNEQDQLLRTNARDQYDSALSHTIRSLGWTIFLTNSYTLHGPLGLSF